MRGQPIVLTNERFSHKVFVDGQFVGKGMVAGMHTIRLEPVNFSRCGTDSESIFAMCTSTDVTDSFHVTTIEIPAR